MPFSVSCSPVDQHSSKYGRSSADPHIQPFRLAICFATRSESTSNTTRLCSCARALSMHTRKPQYSATLLVSFPIACQNVAKGWLSVSVCPNAAPYPASPAPHNFWRRLAPSDRYRTAPSSGFGGRTRFARLSFRVRLPEKHVSHGQSSTLRIKPTSAPFPACRRLRPRTVQVAA